MNGMIDEVRILADGDFVARRGGGLVGRYRTVLPAVQEQWKVVRDMSSRFYLE